MTWADGRVMLISGAAGGIGAATSELWRSHGGIPVGLDVCAGESGRPIWPCDVADENAVQSAVARVLTEFGRLDAVVHCAGLLGQAAPADKLTLADWRRVIDVHLTGGFLLAKHSIAAMSAAGGSLVFIGSIVTEGGTPLYPAYGAAKAALVNLAMSLAASSRRRVRANVVSPGSVAGTGLLARSRGLGMTAAELAVLAEQIPVGRAATPGDVAEAICFLSSPAARHITGSVLVVDGGERLPRKLGQPSARARELGHA